MIYTIGGCILGGISAHIFCKLYGVNSISPTFIPSETFCYTCLGMLLGAGVGAGFGINKLITGDYP